MANNKVPEGKWSDCGKVGYPLMGRGLMGSLREFVAATREATVAAADVECSDADSSVLESDKRTSVGFCCKRTPKSSEFSL
jgi:hypothetical protein